MHRLIELQACQPAPMQSRPRRSVVMVAIAQQEAGELLSSLPQAPHRRYSRTNQIADRLVCLVGHPDLGQFAGAVQPGEVVRIPPVSLDPIPGLSRHQRRSHHRALVPHRTELSLHPVAARTCLVAKSQLVPASGQLCGHCLQRCRGIQDLPILSHFPQLATQPCFGHAGNYRILVHIKPGICDSPLHDPSSYA